MGTIYCIVCMQGEMGYRELIAECKPGNWLPLLVMRQNGRIILPCFPSTLLAFQFAKRNLPPKWLKPFATICPTLNDAQLIDSKGWEVVQFNFPRLLVDVVEFDIEVVEFEDNERIFVKS